MIPSRVGRNPTCQYWSIVASCELSGVAHLHVLADVRRRRGIADRAGEPERGPLGVANTTNATVSPGSGQCPSY
jgi:hypothetical protein